MNAMEYLEKGSDDYYPYKEGVREIYYNFSRMVELSQYEPYEFNKSFPRQFAVANTPHEDRFKRELYKAHKDEGHVKIRGHGKEELAPRPTGTTSSAASTARTRASART